MSFFRGFRVPYVQEGNLPHPSCFCPIKLVQFGDIGVDLGNPRIRIYGGMCGFFLVRLVHGWGYGGYEVLW